MVLIIVKDMVTEGDEVTVVGERHHSLRVGFWNREEVLQNARDTLSQWRRQVIEEKVRIDL